MNKLNKILDKSYHLLNRGIPILNSQSSKLHHNKYLIKYNKPSEKTFEGSFCCGASCYLLSWFLEKHDIKTTFRYSKRGYGDYLEDHVFLMVDDIIIDPTYRQMFSYNLTLNINTKYVKYLYNDLPFYFVGDHVKLVEMYKELSYRHIESYDEVLDDNLVFWNKSTDIYNFCDLDKVEKDFEYAKSKGDIFINLYKYIK
tara:strand:- start:961 stop:1557 length:597 start_codon:yes stop_codon:yes gene_type:complete